LYVPAIQSIEHAPPGLMFLLNFFSIFCPDAALIPDDLGSICSKNPNAVDIYTGTKYSYRGKRIIRSHKNMAKGVLGAYEMLKDYTTPFLIVTGGLDKIINPEIG
jgi:hypothetical protein